MKYYIFVGQDGNLNGCGQCKQLSEGVINVEVSENLYNSFREDSIKYIYKNGKIIDNPNFENEKQAFFIKERINEIYSELEILKDKYILILLSDNWPCCKPIMDNKDLSKYFNKIYISSVYGTKKIEGDFFDYLINDFNIKEGEAYFVDDNESILDVAVSKGLEVRQMDREKVVLSSKYTIINDLKCFY
jgi:HAD superfamily hydrolase (TIGR01509 family)